MGIETLKFQKGEKTPYSYANVLTAFGRMIILWCFLLFLELDSVQTLCNSFWLREAWTFLLICFICERNSGFPEANSQEWYFGFGQQQCGCLFSVCGQFDSVVSVFSSGRWSVCRVGGEVRECLNAFAVVQYYWLMWISLFSSSDFEDDEGSKLFRLVMICDSRVRLYLNFHELCVFVTVFNNLSFLSFWLLFLQVWWWRRWIEWQGEICQVLWESAWEVQIW